MFRFAQPLFLYLLLLVPLMWALYLYARHRRRRNLALFGKMAFLQELAPDVSRWRPLVKMILQSLAFAVVVFILARPQFGTKLETVKTEGVEIVVALDVSNSMLAHDINPSRLEKAKMMLSKLVDDLENDKVGLVVFAGDAYTQLPITTDYVSAKMFLNSIDTQMVPTQGTAIGQAIKIAMNSFSPESTAEQAIIVITDGENHEDNATEAARMAAEKGIKVSVVGIGSTKGAPIPISGSSNNFMKDAEGKVVITKLNETMAQEVAQAGEGIYVRADNTNGALQALINEVRTMKSAEFERKTFSEYNEQFPGLAWIALVLLFIDAFLLERKYGWISSIHIFNKKK
ncbi:MAG: VWA domain-containing protein [Bacteroidaceae bacterium]|nr:VWA domain-containing protein [Bacteroidaceae bacterium]